MAGRLLRSNWIWAVALILGAEAGLYYALVGWPATPPPTTSMTVDRADNLFRQAFQSGQSREDVETWLTSQGIPQGDAFLLRSTSYELLRRPDDGSRKGEWMDARGDQTVAECAGLNANAVDSIIRVSYPDSGRRQSTQTEVRVYLFFDRNDRLLGQWVDEFYWSL